jgi:hypothetical protein
VRSWRASVNIINLRTGWDIEDGSGIEVSSGSSSCLAATISVTSWDRVVLVISSNWEWCSMRSWWAAINIINLTSSWDIEDSSSVKVGGSSSSGFTATISIASWDRVMLRINSNWVWGTMWSWRATVNVINLRTGWDIENCSSVEVRSSGSSCLATAVSIASWDRVVVVLKLDCLCHSHGNKTHRQFHVLKLK